MQSGLKKLRTAKVGLGKNAIAAILDAGFNLDFIDDEAIDLAGVPYAAIVLPGVERIPLATYPKLRDYAQQGGVLIATRRKPGLAPGFLEGRRDSGKIQELSGELFEGDKSRGLFIGDETGLGAALARRRTPDVELNPKTPEIGFVHRKLDTGEIYFLANVGNRPQDVQATFRVKRASPERWDPFTGTRSVVRWSIARDGRTVVLLHWDAYESVIFMFSSSPISAAPARSDHSRLPVPIDMSRDWKVSFTGRGKSVQMDRLRSWTDLEGLRFFSGHAVYDKSVSVPEFMLKHGAKIYMNFGNGVPVEQDPHQHGTRAWIESPVREAAVVYVNGRRAGSVWHPPFELEVTAWLLTGMNEFRVVVGNLAINSMAGKSLPDYRLLDSRYGKRFSPQDMYGLQPLHSGLMGPITLLAR